MFTKNHELELGVCRPTGTRSHKRRGKATVHRERDVGDKEQGEIAEGLLPGLRPPGNVPPDFEVRKRARIGGAGTSTDTPMPDQEERPEAS